MYETMVFRCWTRAEKDRDPWKERKKMWKTFSFPRSILVTLMREMKNNYAKGIQEETVNLNSPKSIKGINSLILKYFSKKNTTPKGIDW